MCLARTSPGSEVLRRSVLGCSTCIFSGTRFRLRMRSVVSSIAPGMGENSCSTPSTRTAVMAAPSMRGEQHAPQRVAHRGGEPALEGLRGEAAEIVGLLVAVDFEPLRLLEPFPQHLCVSPLANIYFEYSSTMSCSWIGKFTSSRAGMRQHLALHAGRVQLQPLGHAAALHRLDRGRDLRVLGRARRRG